MATEELCVRRWSYEGPDSSKHSVAAVVAWVAGMQEAAIDDAVTKPHLIKR